MPDLIDGQIRSYEGVQRGWPLPIRLVMLVAAVAGLGLWLLSAGGGGDQTVPGAPGSEAGGSVSAPGSVLAPGSEAAPGSPSGADGGQEGQGGEVVGGSGASGGLAGAVDGRGGAAEAQVEAAVVEPDVELLQRLVEGAAACDEPVSGLPVVVGVATDPVAEARGEEAVEVVAARRLTALVNCVGGVSGRPLVALAVDVGGSPLTSREGVAELLDASPVAILGPRSAEVGLRLLEAVAGRVPTLFPLSTEPALDDPARAGFLLGPDTATLSRAAAHFALEQGWDTGATLSAPGPHVALAPVVFAEAFGAGGGTAALDLPYVAGQTDEFAEQVARLADPLSQDEPDVIFTAMPAAQLAALQAEAIEAGIGSAFLTVDGKNPDDGGGWMADGTLIVGRGPDGDGPGPEWFDRSSRSSSGAGFDEPLAAARVADALLVVMAAAERAGPEPEAIEAMLADGILLEGFSGLVGTGRPATHPRSIPVVEMTGGRATLAGTASP